MPIIVPTGSIRSPLGKPDRLNTRYSTIRPAQSATQARKTFLARATSTVVVSILTILTVKNELQQLNPGIKIPGGKLSGWGNFFAVIPTDLHKKPRRLLISKLCLN